jgi:hypothetical protein
MTLTKAISIQDIGHTIKNHSEQLSEGFWFTAAFILFLLLGPFSAPIAVIAIFSLRKNKGSMVEPEPATQKITSNK